MARRDRATDPPERPDPPPHSLDAEQALLSAILLNPHEGLSLARRVVRADDFYDPLHGRMFATMVGLRDQGSAVDPRILAAALQGEPDIAEGWSVSRYIGKLLSDAVTVINLVDYARLVRDLAAARRALRASERLRETLQGAGAVEPYGAVTELIGEMDRVLAIREQGQSKRVSLEQAIQAAIDESLERHKREGQADMSTGLPRLDEKIGGLWRGNLVVLAGRPGMGKSAFMVSLAVNAAREEHAVGIFSYEMSPEELGVRATSLYMAQQSAAAWLPYTEIRKGNITAQHYELFERAKQRASGDPVEIVNASGMTVHDIVAASRRLKVDYERRDLELKIVFVDYLQRVVPGSRYTNRVQEIGEITAALKSMATELNVCVVLLSQLSRQVEAREDKTPRISDLRESGDIEQDADLIVFLLRRAYYLEQKTDRDAAESAELEEVKHDLQIIIAKQRQGPVGHLKAWCDLSVNLIVDARPGGGAAREQLEQLAF